LPQIGGHRWQSRHRETLGYIIPAANAFDEGDFIVLQRFELMVAAVPGKRTLILNG
jgi:hypothetical protein